MLEDLGKFRHDHSALEVWAGLAEIIGHLARVEIPGKLGYGAGVGVLPTQEDGGDATVGFGVQLDLVQGGDGVPRADLARVHTVVAELVVGHGAILEADQAVAHDHLGVEVHLHLGIHGDGLQGARQLVDEQAAGLVQVVDVGVEAVAVVSQLLHQGVVVIVHAKAEGGQGDALLHVAAHLGEDRIRFGLADVGDPVRAQDDAVDAVGQVGAHGLFVSQAQARLGVGGAFRLQAVDRIQDPAFGGTASRLQHHAGAAAVDHDADGIVSMQLFDQQFQRALDQPQAVVHVHRTRDVDHEGQGGILAFLIGNVVALDADADHVVAFGLGEGRGPAVDGDAKGLVGGRVVVSLVEKVDIFLDADGINGRQVAVVDVIAHDGIGTRVHIQRKGGQVVIFGVDGWVDPIILEEHIVGFISRRIGLGLAGRWRLTGVGRGRLSRRKKFLGCRRLRGGWGFIFIIGGGFFGRGLRGGRRAASGHEHNQEQGAEQGKAFGEHGFFSSFLLWKN